MVVLLAFAGVFGSSFGDFSMEKIAFKSRTLLQLVFNNNPVVSHLEVWLIGNLRSNRIVASKLTMAEDKCHTDGVIRKPWDIQFLWIFHHRVRPFAQRENLWRQVRKYPVYQHTAASFRIVPCGCQGFNFSKLGRQLLEVATPSWGRRELQCRIQNKCSECYMQIAE